MPDAPLTLVSERVLIGEALAPAAVVVRDGRIAAVEPGRHRTPAADGGGEVVDLGDAVLSPGLIDLHIHGAGGRSFEEADARADGGADDPAVPHILRVLAADGVTSAQASLASDDIGPMVRRTRALHRWRDEGVAGGAELLGVHLEGPFLAAAQCGAHASEKLRAPAPEDVEALAALQPAMITLAPELPGALDAVRVFRAAGTVVAAGHSEAEGPALHAAMAVGLTHATHLWSGQSTTTRRGPWRVPGLLEESLTAPGLTAEAIADGRHLPPPLLEIARRCLGPRLAMVSDATAGAGMPEGFRYPLSAVECEVRDGVGMVVGADSFGGSTTLLRGMLAHLHQELGWPLPEVLAMGTSRPARIAGVADRKGAIAVGMDADLLALGADLEPQLVLVRGERAV